MIILYILVLNFGGNMKKILLALLLVIPVWTMAAETTVSMTGSSGLIAVPSGDTLPNNTVYLGSWVLLANETGYLPRFAVSILQGRFEIGGGGDIQHPNDPSWLINAKYKLYDDKGGGLRVSFGGDYQHNSNANLSWDNGQLFLAFTWEGWAKTSVMFGKTFGDFTEKNNIDFGIGVERTLWSGGFGSFGLILDFVNYEYRLHKGSIRGAGETQRGIFSGGIRLGLFKNLINVDFASTDLLDASREFVLSAGIDLHF